MPKKPRPKPKPPSKRAVSTAAVRRSLCTLHSALCTRSPLLDTRVIFCGDNLDKLADFPDASVDLIYIDPPFNSNRNYEVFWGETREKRSFEDRHAPTQAYLDFMRPRCLGLASLAQSQTLRL